MFLWDKAGLELNTGPNKRALLSAMLLVVDKSTSSIRGSQDLSSDLLTSEKLSFLICKMGIRHTLQGGFTHERTCVYGT